MAGKITRIVAQDKNPNRVSVYVDGAFAFGVYQDLLLSFSLAVGRTLTDDEMERIQTEEKYLEAKMKAVNFIAYKARTEHEVRSRLTRTGYEVEVVSRVVDRLYELSMLDDEAYARSFVTGRLSGRGYGPKRLRSDLLRRGVSRSTIEEVLENAVEPGEALQAAREQAEKRWARLASEPDPRKRRKKLTDFLVRRGFAYDTVRQVVEAVSREG